MTQSVIETIIAGKSRLAVMRCLYESNQALTGREIARRTKLSAQQAHLVLRLFAAYGVVGVQIAAPAHLFTLNRKHWVITEVFSTIFENEKNWLKNLINKLCDSLPPAIQTIVLFGSAATGQLRAGSDIDLLILVESDKNINTALLHFTERSAWALERGSYPLAPIVLTIEDFRLKYKQKDDFVRSVLKTGSVVYGKLMTEIL